MKMSKETYKKISSFLVFQILWKYERGYPVWSLFHIIVSSALPIISVYIPKTFIQALSDGKSFSHILNMIMWYGFALLVLNVLRTLAANRKAISSQRFIQKYRRSIGQIAMSLELSQLETAAIRQNIQLADNASSIVESASFIGDIISTGITIAGLAYIIASLDIWCILSIVVVALLKYLISKLRNRYLENYRKLEAANARVGNYVAGLSYGSASAKEIRVNALQQWLLKKVGAFRNEMLTLQFKNFGRDARFDTISTVMVSLQSFVILTILTNKYAALEISIAAFTMLFSAVTSLTSALSSLGEQINRHKQKAAVVKDYQKLPDFVNVSVDFNEESAVRSFVVEEIVFEHVYFSYPGSDMTVLNDICLKVNKGEKLVLVGLNGSGKTTLIKLLCKFYRPSKGKICVNGRDIWTIENEEYYKYIASVFQDYANFAFSISENICFGKNIDKEYMTSLLHELNLKYADAADVTYNTKLFSSDGIELSGGEAQKIAIARALLKNAQILILDEPTANLDIQTESEIYDQFIRLSENKTAIYVSHRLACVCIADTIAVFKGGKIVEYGTHTALMNKQGLYCEMYTKQSSAYSS